MGLLDVSLRGKARTALPESDIRRTTDLGRSKTNPQIEKWAQWSQWSGRKTGKTDSSLNKNVYFETRGRDKMPPSLSVRSHQAEKTALPTKGMRSNVAHPSRLSLKPELTRALESTAYPYGSGAPAYRGSGSSAYPDSGSSAFPVSGVPAYRGSGSSAFPVSGAPAYRGSGSSAYPGSGAPAYGYSGSAYPGSGASAYGSGASAYGSGASAYGSGTASGTSSFPATGSTNDKQIIMDVLAELNAKVVGTYDQGVVNGSIKPKTFYGSFSSSSKPYFEDDSSTKQVAIRSGNEKKSVIIVISKYFNDTDIKVVTKSQESRELESKLISALSRKRLGLKKLVKLIDANDVSTR